MDPDQCLLEIRRLIKEARKPAMPVMDRLTLLDDLVERIDALDEWCTKQGFPPAAWRETRGLTKGFWG